LLRILALSPWAPTPHTEEDRAVAERLLIVSAVTEFRLLK